jgi:hypothetical protein
MPEMKSPELQSPELQSPEGQSPELQRPLSERQSGYKSREVSRLARVSHRQFGVFTRDQVIEAGLSDNWLGPRVRRGDFVRLQRGVFSLKLAPSHWERNALAACLAGPPSTVLSHKSAARALGLSLVTADNDLLDVTIPHGNRLTLSGARVHRTRCLQPADRARIRRLPVTNVARTLIDLVGIVSDLALKGALDDALTRRLSSPALVLATIERNRHHSRIGSAALQSAVMPWLANPLESPAEAEMLRILTGRGLPAPTTQVTAVLNSGAKFRLDFAWVSQRVALEVDGFQCHDGPERFVSDRHRANLLTEAGWHVLRTTFSEIRHDPEPLCQALLRVLVDGSSAVQTLPN